MKMDRRTRRKSTHEKKNPLSPPRKKRKEICHIHTPQSHLSTPPPEDNDWETKSLPGLVTPDEDQDSMTTQGRKSPEVPADQDADKDFFQDSKRQSAVRQKYGSEIKQAPWNPQADSDNP